MALYPLLYVRIVWELSKFPMFGLLPKKLNQFPVGGSGAFVLLKSAPGNSNVHSHLRTIEM